jgi:molecular chaperone GrpE
VAETLEATVTKLGLERYGEPGDSFDPTVHEALMHEYSDEVEVPTCTQILMPGYRYGSRILRPARVAVAEPTEALPVADDADNAAVGETDED